MNGCGEDKQRAERNARQDTGQGTRRVPNGGPDGVPHGPDGLSEGARVQTGGPMGALGMPNKARQSARREPCHRPHHFSMPCHLSRVAGVILLPTLLSQR
jgi:hypothetical protein